MRFIKRGYHPKNGVSNIRISSVEDQGILNGVNFLLMVQKVNGQDRKFSISFIANSFCSIPKTFSSIPRLSPNSWV